MGNLSYQLTSLNKKYIKDISFLTKSSQAIYTSNTVSIFHVPLVILYSYLYMHSTLTILTNIFQADITNIKIQTGYATP